MADYCQQCSIELFGKDYKDLKGLIPEDLQYATPAICEGCGMTTVDSSGKCVGGNCNNPAHDETAPFFGNA